MKKEPSIKEFVFGQLYTYFWSKNNLSNLFPELGAGEVLFLMSIYFCGGKMSPKDVATQHKVSKSRVANAAKGLEKKNYLDHIQDSCDHRKKYFTLTKKGLEFTKIIEDDLQEYSSYLEETFGKEKMDETCLFLQSLTDASEQYYQKKGHKND